MDFNTAVKIIRKDLEEARELLEQIAAAPAVPAAEIQYARSKVRSAAELLELLPGLMPATPAAEKSAEKISRPAATALPAEETDHKKEEVAPKEDNKTPGNRDMSNEKEAAKAKGGETSKVILADRFNAPDRLGEQITTAKQDEIIVSVRSARPIDDIASAIGINDKFYFIRELFSGDSLAYQDTIKRLNSASSLGEAMRILDESTVMGSDPAAQSAFVDVVRRKFNLNV